MKIKVIVRYYFIGLICSISTINLWILVGSLIQKDFTIYQNSTILDFIIIGVAFWIVSLMLDIVMLWISKKNSIIYKIFRELEEIDKDSNEEGDNNARE